MLLFRLQVTPRQPLDGSTQLKSQSHGHGCSNKLNVAHTLLQPRTSHSHQIRAVEISPTFGAGNKLACLTLQPQQPPNIVCLFDAGNQSQWPVCCALAVRISSCRNNGILIIFQTESKNSSQHNQSRKAHRNGYDRPNNITS